MIESFIRSLDPDSVILIFILSCDTIVLPFFFHLIRGLGLPVAAQSSDSPLPSLTVLSFGLVTTDGGVPTRTKIQNYFFWYEQLYFLR